MGVTLGKKNLKSGRTSLFLDYCFNGKRKKEYLRLVLEPPVSSEARCRNREKMELARNILIRRELELISGHYNIKHIDWSALEEQDFFLIFEGFIADYKGKDIKTVKASLYHLRRFSKVRVLPLNDLTKVFCQQFYDYLTTTLHGSTPIGYFKKFTMCLETCVEKEILMKNPASYVKLTQQDELTKDILSMDEIVRLARTPCPNSEVKRAFLFACNTGLRWCDIVQLTYRSVDIPNQMLHLVQSKVKQRSRKAMLHLTLNSTAMKLLDLKSVPADNKVFRLPSYSYMLRVLRKWVNDSGLSKHITFHCGRHSFITNIMINGANIKTASELAGHSTIRHTEKYVHVIDELKRKAVNSLPDLPLDSFV